MPWKEQTVATSRAEFVRLTRQKVISVSEACRRAGISRKTGYKWLHRCQTGDLADFADQSRRPKHSPYRTDPSMERLVVQLRREQPAWGGRTISRILHDQGYQEVPHPNTITDILRRHHLLIPITAPSRPWQRFQHEAPNDLWQMDFKGDVRLAQGRCHPLTILDDHSRFAVGLHACLDQQTATVREQLIDLFRRYGLPRSMLMDNGSPWGSDREHPHTPLTVWLMRLGIVVSHGRPYHPQTQGKVERFHRTLQAELLRYHTFRTQDECQQHLDRWRDIYNQRRPHQALDLHTPISRYQPSPRSYPEQLPELVYGPEDQVRMVQAQGWLSYLGRDIKVSKAFRGQPVAIRPTLIDGVMEIYFAQTKIKTFDLT